MSANNWLVARHEGSHLEPISLLDLPSHSHLVELFVRHTCRKFHCVNATKFVAPHSDNVNRVTPLKGGTGERASQCKLRTKIEMYKGCLNMLGPKCKHLAKLVSFPLRLHQATPMTKRQYQAAVTVEADSSWTNTLKTAPSFLSHGRGALKT